ncbi:Plasma-membrane_choline transporter and transmembrane domain-containing protein [Hexamita inflata]|uniref:Plasma-membrane choline transporter and transmembrane domain-containing protein n=1 Tax=Hexamita inflata TaxID=28002 RepID=A0AA86U5Y8_9EUKA|nr:Plasma-membrane choline transporter and transmembrane domain-containing protein [Hexamita inflata]
MPLFKQKNVSTLPSRADVVSVQNADMVPQKLVAQLNLMQTTTTDFFKIKENLKSRAVTQADTWLNPKPCCSFNKNDRRQKRKCTDFICLIIYAICWILSMYCAFGSKEYKISNSAERIKLFMAPSDDLRRMCGEKADMQIDKVSVDYSSFLSSYDQIMLFCDYYVNIAKSGNINALTDPQLQNFKCNTLVDTQYEPTVSQSNFQKDASQDFFKLMAPIYNDMSDYNIGYVSQETICVKKEELYLNDSLLEGAICQPKVNIISTNPLKIRKTTDDDPVTYVCHRESLDLIQYLANYSAGFTDSSNNVVPKFLFTDFSELDKKSLEDYAEIIKELNKTQTQFLTDNQYTAFFGLMKAITPQMINLKQCNHSTTYYVCPDSLLEQIKYLQSINMNSTNTSILLNELVNSNLNFPNISPGDYAKIFKIFVTHGTSLIFMKNLCKTVPNYNISQFYINYIPQTIKVEVKEKCIINSNTALSNSSAVNLIQVLIQYFSSAFNQPLPQAIQEVDMAWQNLLYSIILSVIITIIFQVLLYWIQRLVIITSLIGVIVFVAYFTYFVFKYALKINEQNKTYYISYGQYNSTYQLQFIVFIVLGVLLCFVLMLALSVSCLFFGLANKLADTIKIAKEAIVRFLLVLVLPLLFMAASIGIIILYVWIILQFLASGRYDARYVTFSFMQNGNVGTTDGTRALILAFQCLMLLHHLFFLGDIFQYIMGACTIQHYFYNHDGKSKKGLTYVANSLKWTFLQLGSIALKSFLTMIMVWLRFVFQMIVRMFPNVPEGFSSLIVKFSRMYVSVCSLQTNYAMALTGKSVRQSAKAWREFINPDQDMAYMLSWMQGIFTMIGSLIISLVTWLINYQLKVVFPAAKSVKFIWITIINFFLSYLSSTFVTQITDYIMKGILFCFNFEQIVGANKVMCEPDSFKNLRMKTSVKND